MQSPCIWPVIQVIMLRVPTKSTKSVEKTGLSEVHAAVLPAAVLLNIGAGHGFAPL